MNTSNSKLMDQHLKLVIEANKKTNLTRISSLEAGEILHIEDSLVALPEIDNAPQGLYADIGTGGGFPGIPVAIQTGRTTLLVDSVKKKMAILDSIIEELGLADQITTYAGRIEDLSIERPSEFSLVTARALSSLPSLLELASPLLKLHGQLICYKVRIEDEDLACAKRLEKRLGMKLVSKRSVLLSDGESPRCILVFEKFAQPKMKLPRRVGLAQKKPLN